MISQTVEYALRAMSFLASLGGRPVNCETISHATGVPKGYLSKVMRALVCADLVKSFRGPHGGFTLAREPSTISLLDIVDAVEPIRRFECCPLDNPRHEDLCGLHRCLDDALAHIETMFRQTTLGTVLSQDAQSRGGHWGGPGSGGGVVGGRCAPSPGPKPPRKESP